MSFTYHIDEERKLVICIGSGVVTADDIARYRTALHTDPAFNPDFGQLSNFTQVTRFRLDHTTVRAEAGLSRFSPRSKRAAVVSSQEAYGMMRMFMSYRESLGGEEQMSVFNTMDEALEWLQVPLATDRRELSKFHGRTEGAHW